MQFAYCSLYIAVCTLQSAYYSLLEFEFWIWNRMWNWIWNWIWNPILNLCGFNDQKSNLKLNVKLNLELNLELNLKSNLTSFLNLKLKLKLALTFVWRKCKCFQFSPWPRFTKTYSCFPGVYSLDEYIIHLWENILPWNWLLFVRGWPLLTGFFHVRE